MFRRVISLASATFVGMLFLASWGSVWAIPAPLVAETEANPCHPWEMVSTGAFGLGTGKDEDYRSEESFELATYKGSLYLGMEADNSLGARLWRSKPGVLVPTRQADWEEVAALGNAPFGNSQQQHEILQNDHVDSLAVFRENLYASTANGGDTMQGIFVYRSPTGAVGSWTPVNEAGFGSPQNTNFKDMQLFHGWLCGGTQNLETGTQVWCTADGEEWVQKSRGGFGALTDNPDVVTVWSGYVFDDALYFGVQSVENQALLYRTRGISAAHPSWTRVYTGAAGSYRGTFSVYWTGISTSRSPIRARDWRFCAVPPVTRRAGGRSTLWVWMAIRLTAARWWMERPCTMARSTSRFLIRLVESRFGGPLAHCRLMAHWLIGKR